MKSAYRGIAYLIALGVVAQAATIALAWFGVIADLESGAAFTKDSEWNAGHMSHMVLGMMVIPVLALLLVVSSFLTKTRGASKRAGLVFLAVFAQVALAIVAFSTPAVGALHGANALILLGVALWAGRLMTSASASAADPARTAAGVTVPAQAGAADAPAPTSSV